jgi:outer membrane protein
VHLFPMSRPMWRIAVITLIVFPAGAAAQEPLTLDRAVASAVAQNASIRAARAAADEARARRAQARSAWFPTLTFSESWQRGNQPVFVFSSLLASRRFAAANFAIDALNHPDPIGFFQATVGVEQSLFDGGRRRATALAAMAGSESAAAGTAETIAGVAVAATEAFGRLLAAQAARRAATAALESAREDHARATRRRDAGMATDADVLALQVHVADLEQRAIQASGNAASAEADLNRLMGTPIDSRIQGTEPSGSGVTDGTQAEALPVLLAEAEKARPELARAAAAERAAEAGRRQARAALIPEVVAQAAANVSGTRIADRSSSWIAGAELRWRFATGGGDAAAVRASAAAVARARAERDDARAAVHVDVVKAFHQLETARARRAASTAAVEQARESQRIVRDRFDAGLAPVNDVLRASTAVLDADANRIAALVDTIVAAAALRRAIGRVQ